MPLLCRTPFIVTGFGKVLPVTSARSEANLGVVKVDSDGAGYHGMRPDR